MKPTPEGYPPLFLFDAHDPYKHIEVVSHKPGEENMRFAGEHAAVRTGEGQTLMYYREMEFRTAMRGVRYLVVASTFKPKQSFAVAHSPLSSLDFAIIDKRISWYFLGVNILFRPFWTMGQMLLESLRDLTRMEEDYD